MQEVDRILAAFRPRFAAAMAPQREAAAVEDAKRAPHAPRR